MSAEINSQFPWNPVVSSIDWRLSSSTMPPPIPARSHGPERLAFAGAAEDSDAYLSPVSNCQHLEAVMLPVTDGSLCPPLPPRQPLQRSLSLTHRPPPQPETDQEPSGELQQQALADMVAALRLARSQRPVQLTPAASAPLLSQVVPISRWPIREPTVQPASPVRVIPLARWPLVETAMTRRLAMDGIVNRGTAGNGNEYVEGPSSSQSDGCGQRRRARRKVTTAPRLHAAASEVVDAGNQPVSLPANLVSGRSEFGASGNDDERKGLARKIRRFLFCGGGGRSSVDVQDAVTVGDYCQRAADGSGLPGTVCRRCGQCRCSECLRAEESVTLCRARSVVDTLTCMCCVRSVFYHCTKDDAGQDDDCSDAPCACCERPHCAMRWTIMACLLPCLPCLCLYPPLTCTVDAMCRRRHASKACRCARRSRSSGLKGLLESESSSA